MKCRECEYCKDTRNGGNTRGSFECWHPDQKYIMGYFKEHKIQKMPGFIGFGKRYEDHPTTKGAPKWCPEMR